MPAAILPLAEIAALLPERGALIGLDLGTKTIGVAACDPDRRVAAGVETVQRTSFTADSVRLLALAAERKAVVELRNQGRISEEILHRVQEELDLEALQPDR